MPIIAITTNSSTRVKPDEASIPFRISSPIVSAHLIISPIARALLALP